MGLYKDISIYCDMCNTEDYDSCFVKETRRAAKAGGWKRIKIDGAYKDICPVCLVLLDKGLT